MEAGTVESLLGSFGPARPGPSAELPEFGRSRDIARHPTGHPNNGYGHILNMAGGRERETQADPRFGSPAAMVIPYGCREGVFTMIMAVVADDVMAVTITHVKVTVPAVARRTGG